MRESHVEEISCAFDLCFFFSICWLLASCSSGGGSNSTNATLQSIAISPQNATVAAGLTEHFSASGNYSDGSSKPLSGATWTTSDATVATVNSTGLVTTIKQGAIMVTATFGAVTGTAPLTVGPPALKSISVSPQSSTVAAGLTQQFTAIGSFSDGSSVNVTASITWTSSDNNLATINSSGLAKAVAIGRPQITATSESVSGVTQLTIVPAVTATVNRFAYATGNVDGTVSEFTVNPATGQLRHNGYVFAGSQPMALVVEPFNKFAFVANSGDNNISAFSIDPANGRLTAVAGSPFASGIAPLALLVEPRGKFVYIANSGSGNVSAYMVDQATGALTAVAGAPFVAGANPSSIAVDPSGVFVYVANQASNDVSAYKIDANTGVLTPVSGSPFAAGSAPSAVTVDPSGHFTYVGNAVSANVSAFAIDPTSGALSAISGSPFSTGAGMEIAGATVDPSGKFLYVANFGSSSVSAFSISAGGGLIPVNGSPFPVSSSPRSVQIDPATKFAYVPTLTGDEVEVFSLATSGALSLAGEVRTRPQATAIAFSGGTAAVTYTPMFAYVANQYSNTVSMYTIGATTGALASTGTAAAGTQPVSVTVDPSGRLAYVANLCPNVSCSANSNVSAYSIDVSTGALSPVPGSPFTTELNPRSVAVDPSGRFVYVANSGSGSVSAYSIDNTTGALATVAGSPFIAGSDPFSLTVDPTGRFVYVANGVSNNVSAYTVDGRTGALSPVPGSPFSAGSFPNSVTVDPSGRFAYVANECGDFFCSSFGSVSAYAIDSATGVLSPIAGSSFATDMSPRSVEVDPSGRFAYVADGGSSDVSAYSVNSSTGALSPLTGSPFGAGAGPRSVKADPSGRFAFVANQCGDLACTVNGNVSAYIVDGSTGVLSPVSGSPFAAETFAWSVAVAGRIQ